VINKLITILVTTGIVFTTHTPALAEDKEAFFPAALQTDGKDRIFSVGASTGASFSQLGHWPDMLCKSTKDPNCDFTRTQFDNRWQGISGHAMLELCTTETNNDCIENVEISRDGINFRELTFERYMPDGFLDPADGNTFPADAEMNLPRGGMASIWIENIDGKISDLKYLVYYKYYMQYSATTQNFELNKVSIIATPFKEKPGLVWASLWTNKTQSGIQYDFPPNTSLRITTHISKAPSGWFKARMKDIDVQILPFNEKNNKLIVKGSAVTTPSFAVARRAAELNTEEEKLVNIFGFDKGAVVADPADPAIFDYVDYWRVNLKDVAAKSMTSWGIESTTWTSDNRCLRDSKRVLGIVATNAMGYDGNAPKFVDGFLNYRVTGFHYTADGETPNLGTYDLLMRSDAARCLYGFSNAPVSAVVSISSSNGATNVATTVVSEKDGWLKMKAAGFTFSEKTLKVKITQNKNQKFSITCTKGKTLRKVTGTNPKCPTGFKLK
jgi:hypothetical protein